MKGLDLARGDNQEWRNCASHLLGSRWEQDGNSELLGYSLSTRRGCVLRSVCPQSAADITDGLPSAGRTICGHDQNHEPYAGQVRSEYVQRSSHEPQAGLVTSLQPPATVSSSSSDSVCPRCAGVGGSTR